MQNITRFESMPRKPSVVMLFALALFMTATAYGIDEPGGRSGEEVLVNTYRGGYVFGNAVAMNAVGDATVVWAGDEELVGSSGYDIWVRRYEAGGTPVGDQFMANTTTSGSQYSPAVAMASDGRFVVVWSGLGADDDSGIFMQLYDASGTRAGMETRVNTTTEGSQGTPVVAMSAEGNFVIAWNSEGGKIDFQAFTTDGIPVGQEASVVDNAERGHAVAMNDSGDFVFSWSEGRVVGGGFESVVVMQQRFDAAGQPLGAAVPVNTTTIASPLYGWIWTDVVLANDGRVAVAWIGNDADTGFDVLMQRFDADDVPEGTETVVNTTTARDQSDSDDGTSITMAMAADGSFSVAWSGFGQTDEVGVFMQRFGADGARQGGEVLVNAMADGNQSAPGVAMDADGDVFFTWTALLCELGPVPSRDCVVNGEPQLDAVSIDIVAQRFSSYEPLDLSVVLNANADTVTAGGGLSYSVIVTNEHILTDNPAFGAATGLRVTLDLPDGSGIDSASGDGWSCDDVAPLTCNFTKVLSPLAFSTITVDATVPATAGTVEASVALDGDQFDPDFDNNSAVRSTTVTAPTGGGGTGGGSNNAGGGGGGGSTGYLWLTLLVFIAIRRIHH